MAHGLLSMVHRDCYAAQKQHNKLALGNYVVSRAESEVREYAAGMAEKAVGYKIDDRSEPDKPMGAIEFVAPQFEI